MPGYRGQILSDWPGAVRWIATRRPIVGGTSCGLFAGLAALSMLLALAAPGWAQSSAAQPGAAPTQGAVPSAGSPSPQNQTPPVNAEPSVPDGADAVPEAEAVPADQNLQPQADPEQFTDDAARDAVYAGQAVGLGSLLPDIAQRTSGTVIDASMQSRNGTLIYSIRVLRPDGRVTTELYDATTGSYVGSSP